MDKKKQKKGILKRKSGDENVVDSDVKKQKIVVNRTKTEDPRSTMKKVEVTTQPNVEYATIVHNQQQQIGETTTSQLEGQGQAQAQPIFINLKGEQVQLGPNTVIVYEQGNNANSYAFGGNLVMDASGRIVMADTIYDVKDGTQEEQHFVTADEEGTSILPDKPEHDMDGDLLQYAVCKVEDGETDCYESTREAAQQDLQQAAAGGRHKFEIVHVVEGEQNQQESRDAGLSEATIRWLSSKYDFVVRKLQLDYDAGVKLLHNANGILKCIYMTTPAMQLAFHSIPQFLCIESGIEFQSAVSGSADYVTQVITLILAEDGNGKSVIVSAGISPLGDDNMRWLLETFKSCNPAWRQVRCIVTDPEHHTEDIKWCFPGANICSNIFQIARWSCRQVTPAPTLANLKTVLDSILKGQDTVNAANRLLTMIGALYKKVLKLLEADNYTNILHKGIEKVVEKFEPLSSSAGLQPEEFVPFFFQIVRNVEESRKLYALSRLQDTINSKQSPTDTITQYAYFLIHQQTVLAQKALNQKAGCSDKEGPGSILKYGTSTQECSCQFSKVFRLPCRHILMLTTELKVKTHIPFEPRWTVHHCLFGCEMDNRTNSPNSQNDGTTTTGEVKQQYVMSNSNGEQVVYCTSGTSNAQYIPAESTGQPA